MKSNCLFHFYLSKHLKIRDEPLQNHSRFEILAKCPMSLFDGPAKYQFTSDPFSDIFSPKHKYLRAPQMNAEELRSPGRASPKQAFGSWARSTTRPIGPSPYIEESHRNSLLR
eukprot:TRINITY_DN25705_c0_g2_i1.p1 TRINITY_DN25705_c0_g2~~TRINITY_DN25705_c0_g2_i1.p1  ORF type:complete len:113 (-),score=6.12 TRINITY_DN25705_c0_g2_i1:220-558(-)